MILAHGLGGGSGRSYECVVRVDPGRRSHLSVHATGVHGAPTPFDDRHARDLRRDSEEELHIASNEMRRDTQIPTSAVTPSLRYTNSDMYITDKNH